MKYDFAVFIGRFQPPHIGHQHVIDEALKSASRVIILIGSAATARSIRNPFTFDERVEFIRSVYRYEVAEGKIIIRGLADRLYNDTAWIAEVQRTVNDTVLDVGNNGGPWIHGTLDFKIALAGFKKDGTGYYLKMFPEWSSIDTSSQYGVWNSTDIRNDYFRRSPIIPRDLCHSSVVDLLRKFMLTPEFKHLVAEREYIDGYRSSWSGSPFPPIFVTADAVVVQSGSVLLIHRDSLLGYGQLAIPGGFIRQDEIIKNAAVRELKEETAIADAKGEIPPAMLESFIDDSATKVFDDPNRSLRGRVITHAHLFRCPDRHHLFGVRGRDDAKSAAWHRFGDLKPEQFFEDHWSILETMVGV